MLSPVEMHADCPSMHAVVAQRPRWITRATAASVAQKAMQKKGVFYDMIFGAPNAVGVLFKSISIIGSPYAPP